MKLGPSVLVPTVLANTFGKKIFTMGGIWIVVELAGAATPTTRMDASPKVVFRLIVSPLRLRTPCCIVLLRCLPRTPHVSLSVRCPIEPGDTLIVWKLDRLARSLRRPTCLRPEFLFCPPMRQNWTVPADGWIEMTRQSPTKKDRGQPVRGSPPRAKLMSVLPPSPQNLLTGKNRAGEGRRVERIVDSHSSGGHGGDGVCHISVSSHRSRCHKILILPRNH